MKFSSWADVDQVSHTEILVAIEGIHRQLENIQKGLDKAEVVSITLEARVRTLEMRPHTDPEVVLKAFDGLKTRFDSRMDNVDGKLLLATGGLSVLAFLAPFVITAINPQLTTSEKQVDKTEKTTEHSTTAPPPP